MAKGQVSKGAGKGKSLTEVLRKGGVGTNPVGEVKPPRPPKAVHKPKKS